MFFYLKTSNSINFNKLTYLKMNILIITLYDSFEHGLTCVHIEIIKVLNKNIQNNKKKNSW